MIGDVRTVMWKEWREWLRQGGSPRRGWLSLLLIVGVFGIFLPLQFGRAWIEEPALLIYWAWTPLFMTSSVVADSFAGERERHTLETLLASRLSDRAILAGKFGAAVSYGWGLTLGSLAAGLVTVNIAHGRGQLLMYPAPIFLSIIALSLLATALTASIGVLVSLRAATMQQAVQRLSLGIMVILFAPLLIFQVLPVQIKVSIGQALQSVDFSAIVLVAAAVFLALNAVFLSAALARFRRAQLILD
jgi:ABC-2 type transport system permease protein